MRRWRAATPSDPELDPVPVALARCSGCGTARSLGPPPASTAHETVYYAPTRGLAEAVVEPLRRLADADRLRPLRAVPAGGRVLEVGSGDGRFLARLRERGLEVGGIEPSPAARALAEARGVSSFAGGVEQAEPGDGRWDAVIAWHSLEHLEDPAAAIARASGWLRPGGLLVLAVPNRASLQARLGGDRWFHQDVPRHRTHFTAAGATAIAERHGFRVERTRHLVVEQNPLGMWQTLLNRLTRGRDVGFRAIKRDPTVTRARSDLAVLLLAGPVLVPIAIVLELAAAALRRGGTVVVEARARR